MENSIEQNQTETQKPKSKFKRVLKFLGIFFGAIFIFAVLLIFVGPRLLSAFWGKDIPPPNDSDLQLSVVNIPDEENSFFDLLKLSAVMEDGNTTEALVKMDVPKEIDDQKYLDSYTWGDSLLQDLIEKNKEALEIYNAASTKKQFQYDLLADPSNITLDMPLIALNTWRQIARISAIKAIYLMKQGKDDEAFEEAFKSIKIGHDIMVSQINLIGYLVGIAIQDTGYKTINKLISLSSLDSSELKKYQEELEKYGVDNNDTFFKAEYLATKGAIKVIQKELFDIAGIDVNNEIVLKKAIANNFYWKPNQTLNLEAEFYRNNIENILADCGTENDVALYKFEINSFFDYLKLYFTENAMGKILVTLGQFGFNNVKEKKCKTEQSEVATELMFAIKRYVLENQKYPESLDVLVPKYIDSIPNNPLTNKPFDYDKDKKTINSDVSVDFAVTEAKEDIDTFDWQIYRNEEYGFEFKYPNSFVYDEDKSGESGVKGNLLDIGFGLPYEQVYGSEHGKYKSARSFELTIINFSEGIDSFINKIICRNGEAEFCDVHKTATVKIDGKNAEGFTVCDPSESFEQNKICEDNSIYLSVNDKVFYINYFNENKDVSNQIISTFKFIKSLDSDNDGLIDEDEAKYGTDINNPDTDGDGYLDGEEVKNGYNPNGSGKLNSNKNENLCTDEPIDTEIGGSDYPIQSNYQHLQWLGQLFTAANCGKDRLQQLRGVEGDNYTIGSHIILKEKPNKTFMDLIKSIGYKCGDNISENECLEWSLKETIKVDELLKLEPYYNIIEMDDCINCG